MDFYPCLTWLSPLIPKGDFLITQGIDPTTFVGVQLDVVGVLEAQKEARLRDFEGFLDPKSKRGSMKQAASRDSFALRRPCAATVIEMEGGYSLLTCSTILGYNFGYYVFSKEHTHPPRTPVGYKLTFWEKLKIEDQSNINWDIVKVTLYGEEITDRTDHRHRAIVMFCNILDNRHRVLNRTL